MSESKENLPGTTKPISVGNRFNPHVSYYTFFWGMSGHRDIFKSTIKAPGTTQLLKRILLHLTATHVQYHPDCINHIFDTDHLHIIDVAYSVFDNTKFSAIDFVEGFLETYSLSELGEHVAVLDHKDIRRCLCHEDPPERLTFIVSKSDISFGLKNAESPKQKRQDSDIDKNGGDNGRVSKVVRLNSIPQVLGVIQPPLDPGRQKKRKMVTFFEVRVDKNTKFVVMVRSRGASLRLLEEEKVKIRKTLESRGPLSIGQYYDTQWSSACLVKRGEGHPTQAVKARWDDLDSRKRLHVPNSTVKDYGVLYSTKNKINSLLWDKTNLMLTLEDIYEHNRVSLTVQEEPKSNALCLFCPAGYGKSVVLSMFRYFYDIRCKDRAKKLFKGTYVAGRKKKSRSQYLFLAMDMGEISVEWKDALQFEETLRRYLVVQLSQFAKEYSTELQLELSIEGQSDCDYLWKQLVSVVQERSIKIFVAIDDADYVSRHCPNEIPRSEIRNIIFDNIIRPLSPLFTLSHFRMFIMGREEIDPMHPIAYVNADKTAVSLLHVAHFPVGLEKDKGEGEDSLMDVGLTSYLNIKYEMQNGTQDAWNRLANHFHPWTRNRTRHKRKELRSYTDMHSLLRWFEEGLEVV